MTIESIKFTELTKNERDVLALDTKRWGAHGRRGPPDDWLAYGPGLMIRRRLAMKMAHANRPVGKLYGDNFAALMNADGLGHMDGTSVSAVLWLHGDPERMQILRDMRETMSPGQRARLNSAITARRRIEDILKARASGLEEAEKVSSVALLKQQLAGTRPQDRGARTETGDAGRWLAVRPQA